MVKLRWDHAAAGVVVTSCLLSHPFLLLESLYLLAGKIAAVAEKLGIDVALWGGQLGRRYLKFAPRCGIFSASSGRGLV